MELIDLIKDNYKIISVIGMSKNAGKTVALNEVIYQATESGISLGLTSIGRDGERQDVVTCTVKPTIYVDEGTLIATSEALLNCADARLEIMEITDFPTPMGRIIIAKVLHPGNVQIAGPCTNHAIREVSEKMLAYGANLVIVDGALDRVSSASPVVTDATVLSTGAALSRDMDRVIEQTAHRVKLFQLESVENEFMRNISREVMEAKDNVIVDEVDSEIEVRSLNIKTALNAGRTIADQINSNSRYVIIHGSLVTKTVVDIVRQTRQYRNVCFVVRDATKIFIDHKDWLFLKKAGVQVKVLDKINILAVTVNPYSPMGYYFDPEKFRDQLGLIIKDTPVFDVVHGGGI